MAPYWQTYDKTRKSSHGYPRFVTHIADSEVTRRHGEFVRWVKAMGGELRRTRLEIYDAEYRGLHATVDIPEGEDVVKIPLKNAIVMDLLAETELGRKIMEKGLLEPETRKFMYPIVYILEQRLDPHSHFKPYLNVLPVRASSHPAMFTEQQRVWLKGSTTLRTIPIC